MPEPAGVTVIGAGMAGAACARLLADSHVPVRVLERSRVPGGRLAAPQLGGRRVDIGASYFTVSDDAFGSVVTGWQDKGLARPWTDTFDARPARRDESDSGTGPMRWATREGMSSLIRNLLDGLDVTLHHEVGPLQAGPRGVGQDGGDGFNSRVVVLAMPDPQAARLAGSGPFSQLQAQLDVDFDPVITVTAAWPKREWSFHNGVFVNDHPAITFVADDGARRGDQAAVLVTHTSASLAQRHLADPDATIKPVLRALADVLDVTGEPIWTHAHRWTSAKPVGRHAQSFLWYPIGDIGGEYLNGSAVAVAGDSWCPSGRPRVESAWLSGTAVARHILENW
ncbi:MAG: renalase [Pseudonocardiales bacterium]|nr:renalase [Pseudonocardiales bacterium]